MFRNVRIFEHDAKLDFLKQQQKKGATKYSATEHWSHLISMTLHYPPFIVKALQNPRSNQRSQSLPAVFELITRLSCINRLGL
jgi:hypothetical protein